MGHGVPTEGVQQQTWLQREPREKAAGERKCILHWTQPAMAETWASGCSCMQVKKNISPGRTQPKHSLPAHREKVEQYSWEQAQSCLKALCSQLFLLSVHLSTLKLGFLQVLQHLFFPELCECKNICCFLSRQMLCFLLIKTGRREQIV